MDTWKHFSYRTDTKLACPCCGVHGMNDSFMRTLDRIRDAVGPLTVTSGYRCPKYNSRISSTGKDGPHTTGRAVDLRATGTLKYAILKASSEQGLTRFGIGRSFIHIDNLGLSNDKFVDRVIWGY